MTDGTARRGVVRSVLGAPGGSTSMLLRRVVARAVDMFTVLFIDLAVVLLGLAPLMNSLTDRWHPEPWGRALVATVLYAVVATCYEVIFVALRGQTPGKDLCNLKVVDVRTGEAPGWGRALLRTAPFAVCRLVPGVAFGTAAPLVLGISTCATRRRRSVCDLIAGTEVIHHNSDDFPDADDGELGEAGDDAGVMAARGVDPRRRIDRDEMADRYGPRSIRDFINRRIDRR